MLQEKLHRVVAFLDRCSDKQAGEMVGLLRDVIEVLKEQDHEAQKSARAVVCPCCGISFRPSTVLAGTLAAPRSGQVLPSDQSL